MPHCYPGGGGGGGGIHFKDKEMVKSKKPFFFFWEKLYHHKKNVLDKQEDRSDWGKKNTKRPFLKSVVKQVFSFLKTT